MKVFSRTRGMMVVRGAALVMLAMSCSDAVGHGSTAEFPAEAAPSTVLGTTRRSTTRLVTLRTRDSTLVTTLDHPFAKVGAGWTAAGKLRVGDRIETLPAAMGTPILAIEVREVPPTPVYNLTIARTHAYFVGTDALLVHNVDCIVPANPTLRELFQRDSASGSSNPTLRELFQREDEHEERQKRARQLLAEQRERRLVEREKLAAEHARLTAERERDGRWLRLPAVNQRQRVSLNDFPGREGTRDSAYFTYAGLSDAEKASVFLREHGMNGMQPQNPTEIRGVLRQLGLTSPRTPPPAEFPPTPAGKQRVKEISEGKRQARPGEVGAAERDAKSFMQKSSANTFAVTVSFADVPGQRALHLRGGTFTLVAVKKDDGTIVFFDLRAKPPDGYRGLDTSIHAVDVIPTDVDWRFNRQLYATVRDSPEWPVFEVH